MAVGNLLGPYFTVLKMLFTMRLNKWLLSNQFPIDWRLLENIELQQRVGLIFFLFFVSH